MKKFILGFLLCCVAIYSVACGEPPQFETQQQMYAYMEGVWLAESPDCPQHYVFQNGHIYVLTDAAYSNAVQKVLDTAWESGGLDAWPHQTFDLVTQMLEIDEIWQVIDQNVTYQPSSGTILFDTVQSQIVIDGDSVHLKSSGSEAPMTKVSDPLELTGEYYEELFYQLRNHFIVPTKTLLPSLEKVESSIRVIEPFVRYYKVVEQKEDTIVYAMDSALHSSTNGKLTVSKESLYFYPGTDSSTKKPRYSIEYCPSSDGPELILTSGTRDFSLSTMIRVANFGVLSNIPDLLSSSELEALFAETVPGASGEYLFQKTVHDISYQITKSADSAYMELQIDFPDMLRLPELKKPVSSGLDQLDFSKAWRIVCEYDDTVYIDHYVLMEDGTCYVVYADELEPTAGGKGTYKIEEDSISFDILVNWEQRKYKYTFDHNLGAFRSYDAGLPNSVEYHLEADDNSVEKITELAKALMYAPEDSEE